MHTLDQLLKVVDSFRASGAGWKTRIDEALKEWFRMHEKAS